MRKGRNLDDLNRTIGYSQSAVNLTPKENPHRAAYLTNLGIRLSKRYEKEGKLADLNHALEYSQEAADLTPEKKPSRGSCLLNLSGNFSTRLNTVAKHGNQRIAH